jgi:DNA-binding NtrC family response regulator
VFRLGSSILTYQDLDHVPGRPVPKLESLGDTSFVRGLAEAAADLAAKSSLPIMVLGPTGAGKEIMAHRIHEHSARSGPLVVANCATFSREMVGSELFGHVAGAFTGAKTARSGLFAAADKGTLFLDEIAELPLELQAVLLRVLQEQRFRPLGSDQEIGVDVRIISATHQPLDGKGVGFRADLYARLAGFVVDLPGLAERRDEILALFTRFVGGAAISSQAAEALLLHDWPLNVRELKHAAEHAKLFSKGAPIEIGHLPPAFLAKKEAPPPKPVSEASEEAPTIDALKSLLVTHQGSVAEVAKALGKHRNQVYRWLKRHKLDPDTFRPT